VRTVLLGTLNVARTQHHPLISNKPSNPLDFLVIGSYPLNSTLSAAQRWQSALDGWAIPPQILEQAPTSPWVHPPALFTVDPTERFEETPSVARAREALLPRGTVLDVGCGGGGSSMPLARVTSRFTGVDEQQAMLANFLNATTQRKVPAIAVVGTWPDAAGRVEQSDVVICHHVVYNVGDIEPFVRALHAAARKRVVVELPQLHPTTPFSPLWQHFWQLERPAEPTASLFVEVLTELGFSAHREAFSRPVRKQRALSSEYIEFVRTRLCLPASKDSEIASLLDSMGGLATVDAETVWWDVTNA
jgi:SAM-dependent methyltransferase